MDVKAHMRGFYPIVDTSVVDPSRVEATAERIIRAGAGILQLRIKSGMSKEFLELALRLRELTKKQGVLFIVNDRVDIALLSRADGVHLGPEDIPPAHARKILAPGSIIGFSTHTPEELKEADHLFRKGVIDYISFGPVFPTATKKDASPAVGTSMLKAVRKLTRAPLVAIGGITEERVSEVLNSGADAVSMISAILKSSRIEEKVESVLNLAKAVYRL